MAGPGAEDMVRRKGETGPVGGEGVQEELARIVRTAGKELLSLRKKGGTGGAWEGTQYKSPADRIADSLIREGLAALDPRTPVVSEEEEGSWKLANPRRYFLVDPIDGTASFAGGFPGFVTQVALMEGFRPVSAAICAPALDLLYTAGVLEGAYLNSHRLRIEYPERWEILIDNYPEPRGPARDAFAELGFARYVESGSISLKICRVADGTADVFFKPVPVKDWDLAPAHLVLGEAGGVLRDVAGNEVEYGKGAGHPGIVAAKSIAHAERIISWYTEKERGGGKR